MDEKDKEIAVLKAQVAEKEAALTTAQTELESKTKELESKTKELVTLNATIAEKDRIIEVKNNDLVSLRRHGQKLKELSDAEKEQMTAKEVELHNATLALQEQQDTFKKEQEATFKRERDSRIERAVKAIAGNDEKYAAKLRDNMERLKDFDDAQTEEEISKIATEAASLVPDPRPDPIRAAVAGEGATYEGQQGQDFTSTEPGKALAQALGVTTEVTNPANGK